MDGIVFITLVITAVTEAIRLLVPQVNGAVTIGVAVVVGVLVSLVDTELGLAAMTVAEGVTAGLAAAGVSAVAKKV